MKSTIHPTLPLVPVGDAFSGNTGIGLAVAAAHSGDTVEIIAGTYRPASPITPTVTSLAIEDYPNDTVNINQASGVFLINTSGVKISGLTISSNSGTAIAVQSGGSSYSITGNTLQSSSVGVGVDDTGSISGNIFTGDATGIQALGGTDTISNNSVGGGDAGNPGKRRRCRDQWHDLRKRRSECDRPAA